MINKRSSGSIQYPKKKQLNVHLCIYLYNILWKYIKNINIHVLHCICINAVTSTSQSNLSSFWKSSFMLIKSLQTLNSVTGQDLGKQKNSIQWV